MGRVRASLLEVSRVSQAVVVKVTLTTAMANAPSNHRISQQRRRGRRINIFGVWLPLHCFDYALMVKTLKAPTFVRLMNWQALKAIQHFQATGQVTVIVLDNASVHRAQLTRAALRAMAISLRLLLFFLPPYSPQMNRIEDEWLHLKRSGACISSV